MPQPAREPVAGDTPRITESARRQLSLGQIEGSTTSGFRLRKEEGPVDRKDSAEKAD